jgi:holo-[acyl-carrier protein] synthase
MIHGIGTDIVKIERIAAIYERHAERLAERILMVEEMDDFRASTRPARLLAMRFAAKEAVAKAMGTGCRDGFHLRDVGIRKNELGKPEIIWSSNGQRRREQLRIGAAHLSLSDDAGLVIAVVILLQDSFRA